MNVPYYVPKYDVGFICGRFNMLQDGHYDLIKTGLSLCRRLIVVVGSAQEYGTIRNPFRVETRMQCIKECFLEYGDRIKIVSLPDLSNENDISSDWGQYLLDFVTTIFHKKPNIMIYGNDESRTRWFSNEQLKNIAIHIINRSDIPISGTQVRELLALDNREEWMKWIPDFLHYKYDELRAELLECTYYRELNKGDNNENC